MGDCPTQLLHNQPKFLSDKWERMFGDVRSAQLLLARGHMLKASGFCFNGIRFFRSSSGVVAGKPASFVKQGEGER